MERGDMVSVPMSSELRERMESLPVSIIFPTALHKTCFFAVRSLTLVYFSMFPVLFAITRLKQHLK